MFKVGDKVKYLNNGGYATIENQVGKVIKVYPGGGLFLVAYPRWPEGLNHFPGEIEKIRKETKKVQKPNWFQKLFSR